MLYGHPGKTEVNVPRGLHTEERLSIQRQGSAPDPTRQV